MPKLRKRQTKRLSKRNDYIMQNEINRVAEERKEKIVWLIRRYINQCNSRKSVDEQASEISRITINYIKLVSVGEDARLNERGMPINLITVNAAKILDLEEKYIDVVWNSKMRGTAGRAFYNYNIVWLNPNLFFMSEEGKIDLIATLAHEIAHLYTPDHHGRQWKMAMAKLGLKAERTHKMDVSHVKHRSRWYVFSCAGCGLTHRLSPIRLKRMHQGESRMCKRCKTRIDPHMVEQHGTIEYK